MSRTHVTYSELRQNLARYLDEVVESCAPLVVSRAAGKGNVVMMAEAEFAGWQEMVHLVKNPTNAGRLRQSIAELDAGGGQLRELTQPAGIDAADADF